MNIPAFIGKNSCGHVDVFLKHQKDQLLEKFPKCLASEGFSRFKKCWICQTWKTNSNDVKIHSRFCICNGKICVFRHVKFLISDLLYLHLYLHLYTSLLIPQQKLTTLSPAPEPSDWSAVSINTDLYLGTIRSSVSNLMNKFQEELKRLYGKGETASIRCVEGKLPAF